MSLYLALFSILVVGLPIAAMLYVAWGVRRRRQESVLRTRELHALWARSAPTGRVELFSRRLGEHDESAQADQPGSETARAEIAFYLGCAHLAERNPAGAARMFQVAYHADARLKTALVLAFACLKVAGQRGPERSPISVGSADPTYDETELAKQCLETWRELGSPRLGRTHGERRLLQVGSGAGQVIGRLMRSILPGD